MDPLIDTARAPSVDIVVAKEVSSTIETTLYDLMAALQVEVEPGEEALVVAIVAHLLRSGRVKHLKYRRAHTARKTSAASA